MVVLEGGNAFSDFTSPIAGTANSTETFWAVDGQSLQTFAFNITTLGGDREAPPKLRGSDVSVPYMPGTRYVPRVPDSRVITLGMWVIGANEDGTIPVDEDRRRTYDRNWRKLRKLLWRPRKQFTLTKRFWLPTEELEAAGVNTQALAKSGEWALYTATAMASYADGLVPVMSGPARATFTVDLLLSDPFFYGDEVAIDFSMTSGGTYPGPLETIEVLGDDRTTWIEVDFQGPLTAPRISNDTEVQELYLRYATDVPDGESATVRAHDFSATHYPAGVSYKSSGYVQHEGDKFWMYLEPGTTDLALSAQAGTGVAQLRYRPVWL